MTIENIDGVLYKSYELEDARHLLYKRNPDGDKFTFGRILIVAGSDEYSGAPALAAKAAYRSGAGLVVVYTGDEAVSVVRTLVPEAVVKSYVKHSCLEELKKADAVVLGPGLSRDITAKKVVDECLKYCRANNKKLIIDADGLNIVSELLTEAENERDVSHGRLLNYVSSRIKHLNEMIPKGTVITPHTAEFSRLLGIDSRKLSLSDKKVIKELFAKEGEFILVIKLHRTLVIGGDKENLEEAFYINSSGNDGMATGGSGDVLAGVIGALLVHHEPLLAARLGVFIHGAAGDAAAEKLGRYSLMAGDIADNISEVLKF
jgi:NAD(P)H-hydrate epimerase